MTKYEGSAVLKLIKYPHGLPTEDDCGCVECKRISIENESRIKEYDSMEGQ